MAAGDSTRRGPSGSPERERCVRWDLVGISLALAAIVIEVPDLPFPWALGLIVAATAMMLFAFGLPQRTWRRVTEAVVTYIRGVWNDRRSQDAREHLGGAADQLGDLVARFRPGQGGSRSGRLQSVWRSRRHPALTEYHHQHRPRVERAVNGALDAGADDDGTLALAQRPNDMAELNALLAHLRRMVIELDAGAQRSPS